VGATSVADRYHSKRHSFTMSWLSMRPARTRTSAHAVGVVAVTCATPAQVGCCAARPRCRSRAVPRAPPAVTAAHLGSRDQCTNAATAAHPGRRTERSTWMEHRALRRP
jgi:hypothetical protein